MKEWPRTEHKLRIFKIVNLNTKWKSANPNCRRKFIKNLLPENRKENM